MSEFLVIAFSFYFVYFGFLLFVTGMLLLNTLSILNAQFSGNITDISGSIQINSTTNYEINGNFSKFFGFLSQISLDRNLGFTYIGLGLAIISLALTTIFNITDRIHQERKLDLERSREEDNKYFKIIKKI